MMHFNTKSRKGFTLIELLVAMTIFTIVITVAVGAFLRALRTQRQLVSFASANSNISLVLEQMAREVRVGSNFIVGTGGESLTFTNGKGEEITYAFGGETKAIVRLSPGNPARPLTSDNVSVNELQFIEQFTAPNDLYPARITIFMAVSPEERGIQTSEIRLQTTVSARNLGT